MKCPLCKENDAPENALICETCRAKSQYQAKAHLVLEGSETFEWGVVKDCHGCINLIPDDAEVVGVWMKYGDGTFWVSLETPLQALQDKATLLVAELAEERKKQPAPTKRKKTAKPAEKSAFDDLRAKLSGKQ